MKKPYILLNAFQQTIEERIANDAQIKQYRYYCWLPDGYANGDHNIAFDNFEDLEGKFNPYTLDYIRLYMKEVK